MKIRFRSFELLALLFAFGMAGFTAGYLFAQVVKSELTLPNTEKMVLIGSFGILLPLLLATYLISKGIYGATITAGSATRKKRLAH